jgi:choline dehydrogenase-like flavoprotein
VPYYSEAEQSMMIAGPDDISKVWHDTPPYPLPPHRMTTVDRMMKAVMPDRHFVVPNARLSKPIGDRGACCATANCSYCPVNAKMTAVNTLDSILSHPRLDICVSAKVDRLDVEAGGVKRVMFRQGEREFSATGDLYVLGANAIYSPFILLRSGLGGPFVGRYLCEKMLAKFEVYLKGLKHFDGGTGTTCLNTSLLDGEHRRTRGAVALYFENRFIFGVRPEFGRWREVLPITCYIEDIPQESNAVTADGGDMPTLQPFAFSDYAQRSVDSTAQALPGLLSSLPVEHIHYRGLWPTLGHIQGTTRMGFSKADSVVDRDLVHHTLRNLVIVGTSTFPTTGSVNIATTVAALSLRSADHLTRST